MAIWGMGGGGGREEYMSSSSEAKRDKLRPLDFMDAACVSEIFHGF